MQGILINVHVLLPTSLGAGYLALTFRAFMYVANLRSVNLKVVTVASSSALLPVHLLKMGLLWFFFSPKQLYLALKSSLCHEEPISFQEDSEARGQKSEQKVSDASWAVGGASQAEITRAVTKRSTHTHVSKQWIQRSNAKVSIEENADAAGYPGCLVKEV